MKAARGFSLIELMIAVAVVGILAAIAVPSYQNSVRKTYRGNAKAFLTEVAQKEQQILLDRRAYVSGDTSSASAKGTLESTFGVKVPNEFDQRYTIAVTIGSGNPPSFTATATPKTVGKQNLDGWIAIDQAGTKTSLYPDKW